MRLIFIIAGILLEVPKRIIGASLSGLPLKNFEISLKIMFEEKL